MKKSKQDGTGSEMITRYREYLEFLDKKLAKMFEAQKTFIKCKKGCAYCCREGEYPLSELEYINMMLYYNELPDDLKTRGDDNIINLLKKAREKMYECPFLVDGICSVYPARGIICRTFGLISFDEKEKKRIPFCVNLNLNYSEVYDTETQTLLGNAKDGSEPLAYNINRKFLRGSKVEKEFDIFFGEDKPLVEWLAQEDFII